MVRQFYTKEHFFIEFNYVSDTRSKCESKLNVMCNTNPATFQTKSRTNTSNQINLDQIDSLEIEDKTKKKNKAKQTDLTSVELDSLKSELVIVKKALEDQQTMIKELENELKTQSQVLEKKESKIQSLKQTIGIYYFIALF